MTETTPIVSKCPLAANSIKTVSTQSADYNERFCYIQLKVSFSAGDF